MCIVLQFLPAAGRDVRSTVVDVFLVDDHLSFRQALAFVLRQEDMRVAAESGTGPELDELLEELPCADVALAHIDDPAGIPAMVERFRRAGCRTPLLILAPRRDVETLAAAAGSDAAGVVTTSAGVDELIRAVRVVVGGGSLMSDRELREVLVFLDERRRKEAAEGAPVLTTRERQILQLLVDGLSARDIDTRLRISPGTRRTHMSNILSKLGVHSQIQAVASALRRGLIQLSDAAEVDPSP